MIETLAKLIGTPKYLFSHHTFAERSLPNEHEQEHTSAANFDCSMWGMTTDDNRCDMALNPIKTGRYTIAEHNGGGWGIGFFPISRFNI